MNFNNKILQNDLKEIFESRKDWSMFINSTILITGANGFLPAYLVYFFQHLNYTNPNYNIKCYFDSTNNFIDNCVKNNGKVLVHCMYGVSRSATIVCAYLIKTLHIDTLTAYKLLKDKRDIVHPNEGFIRQLNDYYLSL